MLITALALAAAGHRVVVVHGLTASGACTCGRIDCPESTRGKHPVLKSWQRTASDEEQAIRDQFASLRFEPNIGVVLGQQPTGAYVVAIDVDDLARLTVLEDLHGPLPDSRRGKSPRGVRMFYTFSGPTETLKNITGLGGASGVDVKCAGGQVVVAGRNARGEYVMPDLSVPIAELPSAWALAILPPPAPPRELAAYDPSDKRARGRAEKWLRAATIGEAIHVSRASEGTRNTVLYTSACRLFPAVYGVGGSMFEARSELGNAARAAGLDDPEIQRTLDSADRKVVESGSVRVPPPRLRVVEPGEVYDEPPPEVELVMDDGKPAKIAENVARMLALYPGGPPRLDEFADRVILDGRPLKDSDVSVVQGWLFSRSPKVRASAETVWAGILLAASRSAFHPVRDWFRSLVWDGTARLNWLLPAYFGTEDTDYHRAVGAGFVLGMVARVMRPGCQVDTLPVFEGKQGARKSSALRVLAGNEWFDDGMIDPANKDSEAGLQGILLHEIAEFDGLTRKGNKEAIKAFISRRVGRYRPSYGRVFVERPRQSCFAGTTNSSTYLDDETGARRFRPVVCEDIDLAALERDRSQLWAEAVARFDRGEQWWLPPELEQHAADAADARYHHDSWEERLSIALADLTEVTALAGLAALNIDVGKQTRGDQMRFSVVMKRLGWVKVRTMVTGRREYRYARVGKSGGEK